MNAHDELITLLAEKKTMFLACEAITESMCVCPVEELAVRVAQRQQVLDGVAEINGRIKAVCGMDAAVNAAISNSCDRQGLFGSLGQVYDASLSAKAVANRILQNEDTVRGRLEMEKSNALEQIERINASSSVVAGSYYKNMM